MATTYYARNTTGTTCGSPATTGLQLSTTQGSGPNTTLAADNVDDASLTLHAAWRYDISSENWGASDTVSAQLDIASCGADTGYQLRIRTLSNVCSEISAVTATEVTDQSTGVKTVSGSLTGTGAQYLQIELLARRITGHSKLDVEVNTEDADSYITTPYTAASTVGKDLQLNYDIASLIGKNLQLNYDIHVLLGKNLQLNYDLLNIIGKSVQLDYDLLNILGKSVQFNYDLSQFVGKDLQLDYDILVFLGKDLNLPYDLLNTLGKSVQFDYDLLNLVGKSVQLDYDIASLVGKDLNLPYDIAEFVGKSLQLNYDLLNILGKSVQFDYDLLNLVGKSVQLDYDLAQLVGKSVQFNYDMAGAVGKNLQLNYDLLNLLGKSLQLNYDILTAVGKSVQLDYDISALIGKDVNYVYDIAKPISPPEKEPGVTEELTAYVNSPIAHIDFEESFTHGYLGIPLKRNQVTRDRFDRIVYKGEDSTPDRDELREYHVHRVEEQDMDP